MSNRSTGVDEPNIPVHRIRPQEAEEVDIEITAYGLGGQEVDPKSAEALAKCSFDPNFNSRHYWLKRATSGPDKGKLFNHHSPSFSAATAGRVNQATGRSQYAYCSATKEAFDLFMQFLRTGNPIHLRNAERY